MRPAFLAPIVAGILFGPGQDARPQSATESLEAVIERTNSLSSFVSEYRLEVADGWTSRMRSVYLATDPLRFENPRAWEVLHDGLWRAGHEAGGTASKPGLGLDRYRAAYKTGTAEIDTPSGTLNHAWIAGFAPFEEPRIAFVAVVERTPLHGAEACAPIVRAILERFAAEDPAAYVLAEPPSR